jgi:hypothetical protein
LNLTFLNAAFLFAALAALLPLLIHLISRRRVATVDFSSLRFLKELERRKIRRVRLRQILLLVIRSLIILLAALALARPTLRGAFGGSARAHARTSVAIVLDDSASMSRERDDGRLFDRAVAIAEELASLLDEGDQAFLITAGSPTERPLGDGTFSPDVLRETVSELTARYTSTDYTGAVRDALALLAGSRNLTRELYIIGDMQRTGWSPAESTAGVGVAVESAEEPADAERTSVYFMPLSAPSSNVSVTSVLAERRYGGTPGLFTITANVRGHGWRGGDIPVRLFLDGVQAGQAGVEIGPDDSGEARFSVSVDENVWHSGRVELSPDAMSADNARHFVIPRIRRTDVLIVKNELDDDVEDAYFIERALDPTGESARFACSVAAARTLSGQDRGRFAVVVLADVERLDADGTAWLRDHVSSGGGLLLVFGNRTDIRFWNGGLLREFAETELVRPIQREEGVRLAPAGPGHPILEGLVFGERLIDDIQVRRAFELGPVDGEEILELPGVGPALFFRDLGGGEMACMTTGIDPAWNDLPRSGFIVPLFHRVVERLARAGRSTASAVSGEDLMATLPPEHAGRVEVEGPGGFTATAEIVSAGRPAAVVRDAGAPGVYSFRSDAGLIAMGIVNVDPSESDLSTADRDLMAASVAPLPHVFVAPDADMAEAVLQARRGQELWRVFIYAALLLVGVEMLLARPRYVWSQADRP